MQAALIYQHATREREREIAAALSKRVRSRLAGGSETADDQGQTDGESRTDDGDEGSAGVLARVG